MAEKQKEKYYNLSDATSRKKLFQILLKIYNLINSSVARVDGVSVDILK